MLVYQRVSVVQSVGGYSFPPIIMGSWTEELSDAKGKSEPKILTLKWWLFDGESHGEKKGNKITEQKQVEAGYFFTKP